MEIYLAFIGLLLLAVEQVHGRIINNVANMKVDAITGGLENILRATNGKSPFLVMDDMLSRPGFQDGFRWNKCGNGTGKDMLDLTSLDLGPHPLKFPGNLIVSFAGNIRDDIDAPLVMKTTVKRQINEYVWLTFPCIEGVGSCNYTDVCEMIQSATCPRPFVENNVPCQCPFTMGSYKMGKSAFFIPVKVPGGHYYAKLDLTFMNQPVMCLEIYFHIVD